MPRTPRLPRTTIRPTRWIAAAGATALAAGALLAGAAPATAADTNAQPVVIPAMQQWAGGTGDFTLDTSSAIVVDTGLADVGHQFSDDLKQVTGTRPAVKTGVSARRGDIVLKLDPDATNAAGGERYAEEGYTLAVTSDTATVTAPTTQGAFYGTRSILQILMQSQTRSTIPVGTATDWPSYKVRGFSLDVGRRFFTPEFIRDYISMMSWYKMNTFQIHLNDNELSPANGDWSKAYTGFRLKSDNPEFAGLASTDGAYDHADWNSFEAAAASHAMNIIPEIDAPAHAAAIIKWKPEIGLNGGNSDHLDLSKQVTTDTMKSIFAEFAPWFTGPDIHFGADEYPAQYANEFKNYYNTMASYIRDDLHKQPWAWGSFSVMSGSADGYDKDVTIDSWNNGYYGLTAAQSDGFHYVNMNDGTLYVVPFADYYHGGGLNNQSLYNTWTPNIAGDQTVPADGPDGAMFSVWNDLVHEDYTELDVNTLIAPSFPVIAQKTWNAKTPALSYADFTAAQAAIGTGPGLTEITAGSGSAQGGEIGFGATVTASSSDADAPASHLTDGLPLTRWATDKNTADLTIDLGTPTVVGSLEADWASTAAAKYDIEVSNDGVFWQRVAAHTVTSGPGADRADVGGFTARYVRLANITSANDDGLAAWRLAVFPPADLARGATATSSGNETADFPASLAVDGSSSTRWSASYVDPSWITVDLGSAKAFDSIRLNWETASAKSYTVDVSDDGTTWKTIATKTNMPAGARDDNITVPATTARYVRTNVTAKNLSPYLSLYDFEVHAVAAPPVVLTASLDPAVPDGDAPYTKAPELTLATSGSATGTAAIEYRLGDGAWSAYTAPVTVHGSGPVDIEYRATVGDTTATGHGTITVDDPAPVPLSATIGGHTPTTITAGEPFTLAVVGAKPGSTVTATLHSQTLTLGTATAASDGTASIPATVPTDAATGSHTLTVADGSSEVSYPVTVLAASTGGTGSTGDGDGTGSQPGTSGGSSTSASTGGTDSAGLADTGTSPAVGWWALGALLALTLGGGALARRRGTTR